MVYGLKSNVKFFEIEDKAYLEQDGGRVRYNVGGAAVEFVKLIDGKRDMDQMMNELIKIYGPNVETYVLARDLNNFMGELLENGLIELVSGNAE